MKYFISLILLPFLFTACKTTSKLPHKYLHDDGFYRTFKKGKEMTELIRLFDTKLIITNYLEKPDDNGKYNAAIMCDLDTSNLFIEYATCEYKTKGDSIFFKKINPEMPYNVSYKGKIFKDSLCLEVFITDYDTELYNPSNKSIKATYIYNKTKCDKSVKIPVREYKGWKMEG